MALPVPFVYVNHTALRLLLFPQVGVGSVNAGFAVLVSSVVVEPRATGVAFAHPPLPTGVGGTAVKVAVAVGTLVAVPVGMDVRVGAGVDVIRVGAFVLVGTGVNVVPGVHVGNAVCVGTCAYTGARLSSNTAGGTINSQDHLMPSATVLLRLLMVLPI